MPKMIPALNIGRTVRVKEPGASQHKMPARLLSVSGDMCRVLFFGGHKREETIPTSYIQPWRKGWKIDEERDAAHVRNGTKASTLVPFTLVPAARIGEREQMVLEAIEGLDGYDTRRTELELAVVQAKDRYERTGEAFIRAEMELKKLTEELQQEVTLQANRQAEFFRQVNKIIKLSHELEGQRKGTETPSPAASPVRAQR